MECESADVDLEKESGPPVTDSAGESDYLANNSSWDLNLNDDDDDSQDLSYVQEMNPAEEFDVEIISDDAPRGHQGKKISDWMLVVCLICVQLSMLNGFPWPVLMAFSKRVDERGRKQW